MKRHNICKLIVLAVMLSFILCACGDSGNDVIESKKNKATQGATSQPVNPNDATPTGKPGENTPAPTEKAGDKTPTQGAQNGDSIMVTAHFANASYVNQTETIDFALDWDYVLFKKKDFEWTLDLKGQTIVLDRMIDITNDLTFTNGTIVIKEGGGINIARELDNPLFESGELGEAKFVVEAGTGIILSIDRSITFHNTSFIVNGGVGVEIVSGGVNTTYDGLNDEDTSFMQVNGGIGYKIKTKNDEYIYCTLPMQVETNGTGFVFEEASCILACNVENNGGTVMLVDKNSSVTTTGIFMQNSGIGIVNEGTFCCSIADIWLLAKSGLLLKNSGTCKNLRVSSYPGIIYRDTLVINENGASCTDVEIYLFTAENAIGFDNKGDLYGTVKLCGGMPRGGTWGLGTPSFQLKPYSAPVEFPEITDWNYQNHFVNSKVVINRKEGRFIRFDDTYGEIVVDLNATEDETAAYPNTSVGFLNESDTTVYYNDFVFNSYGQGGIAFVNEANARLEMCSEDNTRIDAVDNTVFTEQNGLNLRNGIIFLNKGYFNYELIYIVQCGENSTGIVNDGTMQYVSAYEGMYVPINIEQKGKNNKGLVNNNIINAYVIAINVNGEKNTGFLNYGTAELDAYLSGIYFGSENTAVHNVMTIKSPTVRISSTYSNEDTLAAKNCTGLLNEGEIQTDEFEVETDYSLGGRGLSNASSGKIITPSMLLRIRAVDDDLAKDSVICYNEGEIRADSTRLYIGGTGTVVLMNVGTFRADVIHGYQEYGHAAGTYINNSGVITVMDEVSLVSSKSGRDSYMYNSGSVAFLGSVYIAYHEWDMENGEVFTILENR